MAREQTPRLGLDTFTSGSDLHPDREEFNDRMRRIDDQAAVFDQVSGQTLPDPGVPGRILVFRGGDAGSMRDVIYYDDGESWSPLVPFSGFEQIQNVSTSSNNSGSSTRAARADHTHQLPLATSTTHGALPSADKAALNGRTSSPNSNTIVARDANGRSRFQDPSNAQDAATKRYVDEQVADAGFVYRNFAPVNLNDATRTGNYFVDTQTTQNRPTSNQGMLTVYTTTTQVSVVQQLFELVSSRIWLRTRHTQAGWSSWRHLITESDMTDYYSVQRPASTRNLNQLTTVGQYAFGLDSTNGPESEAPGICEVLPTSSTNLMQRVTLWSRSYRQYCRMRQEGSWSSWTRTV